ncbi:hypothetical protein EZS27_020924, partial [termite gut metagenome]
MTYYIFWSVEGIPLSLSCYPENNL